MRKKACEEINKMFGLNMEVDFSEDTNEMLEKAGLKVSDNTDQKGDDENE